MRLFHGIRRGQNHFQVTAIVKSNMPTQSLKHWLLQAEGLHPCWALMCAADFSWLLTAAAAGRDRSPAWVTPWLICCSPSCALSISTARAILQPWHQLPRAIPSNPADACRHSLTFIIVACVRFSQLSSQVTEGDCSTAWESKQTNLNVWKICRINTFRNTLAFTFSSHETDFLWIMN